MRSHAYAGTSGRMAFLIEKKVNGIKISKGITIVWLLLTIFAKLKSDNKNRYIVSIAHKRALCKLILMKKNINI